MKKNLHYLFILDKSGSMASVVNQTIEGVNGQIDTLKSEAKKNKVNILATLMLFDSDGLDTSKWYDYVYLDKPVEELQHITDKDYMPRGGTPLRDAIGNGITKIKELLGKNLDKKNHNVLVTIFTDGEENTSKEYTHTNIQDTIKSLSKGDRWVFTFIGAGGIKEVQSVATSYGINASNILAYNNTPLGHSTSHAICYTGVSCYVRSLSDNTIKGDSFFNNVQP